jgi:hypothetical protein
VRETLAASSRTTLTSVLAGQGGIGKTQLAVLYAYRYLKSYRGGIFWINAAPPLDQSSLSNPFDALIAWWVRRYLKGRNLVLEAVRRQIATFATKMQLATDADLSRYRTLETLEALLIERWFEYASGRRDILVVIDNLADEDLVSERIVPLEGCRFSTLNCHQLVTTRRRCVHDLPTVDVGYLTFAESEELLLAEAHRPIVLKSEREAFLGLLRKLGGLPLAIKIAGGVIRENKLMSFARLRSTLEAVGVLDVLDTYGRMPTDYGDKIAKTISALLKESWEAIPASDTAAFKVLGLVAEFPDGYFVPRSFVRFVLEEESGEESALYDDNVTRAIGSLWNLQLVELHPGDTVRVHSLIREYVRRKRNVSWLRNVLGQAIRRIYVKATTLEGLNTIDEFAAADIVGMLEIVCVDFGLEKEIARVKGLGLQQAIRINRAVAETL